MAWFTDNQNVVSIVNGGDRVEQLQSLALEIFASCATNSISLEMKWIPRDLNTVADCLSRIIDFDDYALNDDIFRMLDVRWGPHSVDRFACNYNTKLARFNSSFYQPRTEAVDAFTQDWKYDNNWLVRPVSLIVKVINHLKLCKAEDQDQCRRHPIFGQSCLRMVHIGVLLCMTGYYYLITSVSLSEAKLRTVCL